MPRKNLSSQKTVDTLFKKISSLITESRKLISTTINTAEVCTKYQIGQFIVEEEQEGKLRAEYGKQVLANLSEKLTEHYGGGWTVDTLKRCRFFFKIYSTQQIGATVLPQSEEPHKFILSWSHYLVLMRIKNADERRFYEIEAAASNWSIRELQRQYGSSLYERIALSRDKKGAASLAREGVVVSQPQDVIKNPVTLEFIGLKPDASISETKLESAIIEKLQDFLLEMGKGFLFEARQKRFTFDEDNFYVDLVLYNRLLQCYVLVDLKVDKLTHQDLGQMQMYVNYYDRFVKQDFEKPTVGILLCKEKKNALVELTLPKDSNIYAAAYNLYLPDKKMLQAKVKQWIDEFEDNQ